MTLSEIQNLKPNDFIDCICNGALQAGQIISINQDYTSFVIVDACGFQMIVSDKDLVTTGLFYKP